MRKATYTRHIVLLLLVVCCLAACTPKPGTSVRKAPQQPVIYPDYTDITIPRNIAPLNFLLRDNRCEALQVTVEGARHALTLNAKGNKAVFKMADWKELMAESPRLTVTITALIAGQWTEYKPFTWQVVSDELDPCLTYRLIEPDYEIFNNLTLRERCVENFDERIICDYQQVGNRCMNCHTFGHQNPQLSMMYVRGEGGGAVLNQNGMLRKLALKTPEMVSGSVYFGFSPSGRYVVFSTNIIIPAFHSTPSKRLEVYDKASDVYVADLQQNIIIHSPLLADSLAFETFPTFAPDGRHIYFCRAPHVQLPQQLEQLQYRLCRIAFDEQTGQLGAQVDTILSPQIIRSMLSASSQQLPTTGIPASVCHPRVSPNGRYLLFTVQDYGTFPIWHRESQQRLLDLRTGRLMMLDNVNSDKSDTYHSWSSNSRWFVFASKRDDSLYGKPYFCYVDRQGRAHKPFCLPQKDPSFYDQCLKSFNAPELGRGPVPFSASDVKRIMKQEAEPFELRELGQ